MHSAKFYRPENQNEPHSASADRKRPCLSYFGQFHTHEGAIHMYLELLHTYRYTYWHLSTSTCAHPLEPTCLKVTVSSWIDLCYFSQTCVFIAFTRCESFDTGLNDFHRMEVFATMVFVPNRKPKKLFCRSYNKKINADKYENDLSCAPFHVGKVFDNIDVLHVHCWMKCKVVADDPPPPSFQGKEYNSISMKNCVGPLIIPYVTKC